MPRCLILTTFSWPFAQYCRKTLLFHGVLSEKLSILPPGCTDKSLDKLPYTCDNIHIVRNKEEKKNVSPRMFCGFSSNSDFDNTRTRGRIMETIEIVFIIATLIGGAYIIWDALYV